MINYSAITPTEFDEILLGILRQMPASQILSISGIYEILSEEFNNDVLDIWAGRRA